jgi:hypothetical protein
LKDWLGLARACKWPVAEEQLTTLFFNAQQCEDIGYEEPVITIAVTSALTLSIAGAEGRADILGVSRGGHRDGHCGVPRPVHPAPSKSVWIFHDTPRGTDATAVREASRAQVWQPGAPWPQQSPLRSALSLEVSISLLILSFILIILTLFFKTNIFLKVRVVIINSNYCNPCQIRIRHDRNLMLI